MRPPNCSGHACLPVERLACPWRMSSGGVPSKRNQIGGCGVRLAVACWVRATKEAEMFVQPVVGRIYPPLDVVDISIDRAGGRAERAGAEDGRPMTRPTVLAQPPSGRSHALAHDTEVELALLDAEGVIVAVNDAWLAFCVENGGDLARTGVGISYIGVCDAADDVGSSEVGAAVRAALAGELPAPVVLTIPCDAPGIPRLFDVLVSSRLDDEGRCVGATITLSRSEEDTRSRHASAPSESIPRSGRGPGGTTDDAVDLSARLADRERIAAHLNTEVISRLFSIGIGLQGMFESVSRPEDKFRLERYVEALDDIIQRLRTAVFELAPAKTEGMGLKRRLLELIDDSGLQSLSTSVDFSGPLDSDVGGVVGDVVVDVLRAAVSVVTRHSRASAIHISVALSDSLISVEVSDNRTANADITLDAGLHRLRGYAEQSGGDLLVDRTAGGGTLLRWAALLEKHQDGMATFARPRAQPQGRHEH
jgi:signal transduction histidine kinase